LKSRFPTPFRSRAAGTLTALLFCLCTLPAAAQKPAWVPVAELVVGSIGHADPARMSLAMSRCTALHMTLSGLLAENSPELSKGYQEQALKLIQSGILIEMNSEKLKSGIEPDVTSLSDSAVALVKELMSGYNDWLNANYDLNGSYFDPDFEIEMKGCEVASKFVRQMSSN